MKKYIVELLGTFALTLVVALSLRVSFPVPTPILAGFVLMLFVYTIGNISGAHINPGVTVGAWSIGKISLADASKYIIAQFIGALLALLLANHGIGTAPAVTVSDSVRILAAEGIGMFFFTFSVASAIFGKTPTDASGIVVGGSLFIGITIAVLLGSNGVLNPAVALGIHSFGFMYIVAPLVGSILGMQAYKQLQN